MRISGNGIIIDHKKRILLLKRSSYTKVYPKYWTIPGGRWDEWETPEEVTIREVWEETGLNFVPHDNFSLSYREAYGVKLETYKFLGDYSGELKIDSVESDGYAWVNYEEAMNLPLAFEDTDTIEKLFSEWYIK